MNKLIPWLAVGAGVAGVSIAAIGQNSIMGLPPNNRTNVGKSSLLPIKNVTNFLKRHESKIYSRRTYDKITHFVCHHSAGGTDKTAKDFAIMQVDGTTGKGQFPGIGYHYVIYPDGRVEQTNELRTVSWHARGANTKGVGVCFIGNFEHMQPTGAQYNSGAKLYRTLNALLGRTLIITGHNDHSATLCPGRNFNLNRIGKGVTPIKG